MYKNVTIGADIEFFLQKDKEVISAEGLVKGSKYDPFYVAPNLSEFFTTQLDNVLAEITIPPATTVNDYVKNIATAKELLLSSLPERNISLLCIPSHIMDKKFLNTENAQTFGCDVSFSAWTRKPVNVNKSKYPDLRSAGFHVHVGYDEPDYEKNVILIRTLDLYLGLGSVLLEPDNLRRVLYGKAGEYRDKPYGCEYRTLSSFFADSNELINWVYNNTDKAINDINNGFDIFENENDCKMIVNAIDNLNKQEAKYLIDKYNITLP